MITRTNFPDIKCAYEKIEQVEVFSRKVSDILDCRIEETLISMSYTPLCDLPDDEGITLETFLQLTEEHCTSAAESLEK